MSAALGRLAARSRPGVDPRLRSRSLASYADARLHLAALSLVAGAIHALVSAPHFGEYWLFGSFFLAIALFQFAWGAQAYRAPSSALYRVGMCVSLGVVVVAFETAWAADVHELTDDARRARRTGVDVDDLDSVG